MDRGAIEETKTFSMDREAIEIAIKKKLKSSIDSLAVEEVSKSCRDCLKTVFQEEKNTDMNTIKHATQPTIQKNISISQKHLLIKKNVSIKIPKHTHTQKTNLTNFIFQKQVKTV